MGPEEFDPRLGTYRGLSDVSNSDFDVDVSALSDLSFNPVEHHERLVTGTLESDAGREYNTSGFSRRELQTIVEALERDGHRPGGIIMPHNGLDYFDTRDIRYEGESDWVSGGMFYGWALSQLKTEGVLENEVFVVAEDALLRPQHAPAQILVRHPDAVAHYEFGEGVSE
jgi:hypothetical protein